MHLHLLHLQSPIVPKPEIRIASPKRTLMSSYQALPKFVCAKRGIEICYHSQAGENIPRPFFLGTLFTTTPGNVAPWSLPFHILSF